MGSLRKRYRENPDLPVRFPRLTVRSFVGWVKRPHCSSRPLLSSLGSTSSSQDCHDRSVREQVRCPAGWRRVSTPTLGPPEWVLAQDQSILTAKKSPSCRLGCRCTRHYAQLGHTENMEVPFGTMATRLAPQQRFVVGVAAVAGAGWLSATHQLVETTQGRLVHAPLGWEFWLFVIGFVVGLYLYLATYHEYLWMPGRGRRRTPTFPWHGIRSAAAIAVLLRVPPRTTRCCL